MALTDTLSVPRNTIKASVECLKLPLVPLCFRRYLFTGAPARFCSLWLISPFVMDVQYLFRVALPFKYPQLLSRHGFLGVGERKTRGEVDSTLPVPFCSVCCAQQIGVHRSHRGNPGYCRVLCSLATPKRFCLTARCDNRSSLRWEEIRHSVDDLRNSP